MLADTLRTHPHPAVRSPRPAIGPPPMAGPVFAARLDATLIDRLSSVGYPSRRRNTMSQETHEWLNTNTLIGFTEKRGHAWHYRAEDQGAESNHYVGPVPVEDVRRRLFPWHAIEGTVSSTVTLPSGLVVTITDDE